jgi:pyruvate carboxylase subunit B
MAKKRVKFMCTAFRDGFQSVYGARVQTKDFLPAVEAASAAGIDWFEAGGGARFQSLYFYCNEDAFDMMDQFREAAGPNADLQTLARGVNVVGLDSQSSDVIKLHAELFKKHGITTIRNFDALNDVNNLIYSGQCIKDAGLKHQVCVTLMALPPGCEGAHDPDFYEKTLRDILDANIPFDSVCFKDASGTAVPAVVHETIKRARKMVPEGTLLHFHTHETAGISVAGYMAALEAGVDAIDLSLAPVSGGTCQPDIATMWHALRGSQYDLGVDIDKVMEAEAVFKECMKDYFLPPESTAVEPMIPWSPMPGGALTANTQMLRDNNIMDKYPLIIQAMEEVVRRGGFGTSVTPVSQFYFQQAFNNVMFGPWNKIAEGYGKMVLGYFGKTPVEPDPEIVDIASKEMNLAPTKKPVLEINDVDPKKGIKQAKDMLIEAGLKTTEENIFIAAACKDKGIAYLKGEAKLGVRKVEKETKEKTSNSVYNVNVNGQAYSVKLDNTKAVVNGKTYEVSITESQDKQQSTSNEQPETSDVKKTTSDPSSSAKADYAAASEQEVKAPMPGDVLRVLKNAGDTVASGETLLVLEAMKMEVEVKSPADGTINTVSVKQGDKVVSGQTLVKIA